jgi:hypothetical protein
MVRIKTNGSAAVVLDDRYAPVLVSSFFGETDLALAQWYETEQCELVVSQYRLGRRTVNISDATYAGVPNAQMRSFWAAMAERQSEALNDMTLLNCVVVTNAWARGALTAVGWLSPRVSALKVHPSIDAAMDAGLHTLASQQLAAPVYARPYRLPQEAMDLAIVQRMIRERHGP